MGKIIPGPGAGPAVDSRLALAGRSPAADHRQQGPEGRGGSFDDLMGTYPFVFDDSERDVPMGTSRV